MLSHATYKVIHLLGIFLLFSSIGGLWALSAGAGETRKAVRRLLMATHGAALLVILVAGFGMMARLGIMAGWPPWIWIKLGIWLLVGATPALLMRAERAATPLFFLAPLLGAIAAWAALYHLGAGQ
jgi:hypothetical protein